MGIYSDEEYKTSNAADMNYQKKLDAAFRVFAQGATQIDCIHSNISPELIRCEICNDSNINFIFILRNSSGNTAKCGIRCVTEQKTVQINNLKEWKKHLEKQIEKEDLKHQELRATKRTIVRKRNK